MANYSDILEKQYKRVLAAGEKPYQLNRKACQEIDVFLDGEKGVTLLQEMLPAIDVLVNELEKLVDLALQVANHAGQTNIR